MIKYHASVIGEDGFNFTVTVNAETREQAESKIEIMYPCACIDTPMTSAERAEQYRPRRNRWGR